MKGSLCGNSASLLLKIALAVIIIGLLISRGVRMMGVGLEDAKTVTAQGNLESLKTALRLYEEDRQILPSASEGLKILLVKSASSPGGWQARIEPGQLTDPWNHEYNYVQPGVHNPKSYDLFSSGPDGQPNTNDDIGNWDEGN